MAVDPEGSIAQLKGIGPKLQETLGRLGIFRLLDLLIHLPARYQDRSQLTPLGELRAGDDAFVEGEILGSKITFGRSRGLEVLIGDGQRELRLRFFLHLRYFSKFSGNCIFVCLELSIFSSIL